MKSLLRRSVPILIADSDEDNLYLVSTVIQDMGLSVVAVGSGHDAINACQQYQPGLALLETRFPDIDSSEMLSTIRQTRPRQLMAAIAVTSAAMPGDRERCIGMGFDDYIPKPYHIADLEMLICQHIRHDISITRSKLLQKFSSYL